ncbi:kinase-like protein, partial [Dendrothele bispora CBS 962.96]
MSVNLVDEYRSRGFHVKCCIVPEIELATMRFVREHTKIPVPEPCCSFQWDNKDYIAMSHVPGTDLHELKWKTLSSEVQRTIMDQLKTYFDDLRSIPRPVGEHSISSVIGGPFLDARLLDWDDLSGPFENEAEFNTFYRAGQPLDEKVPEEIRRVHSVSHRLVLTHNDVCPRNIMVEGSTVTGIIDWECAAWLPEYWEYVKITNWKNWEDKAFKMRASEFLQPYPEEALADSIAEGIPYIPFVPRK